jgi:hypothetical protein
VDLGEEHFVHRKVHALVGDADETDVPTGTSGADRLQERLLGPDGFDHAVRPEPSGEFLDLPGSLIAAFGDDVCGAELAGQRLPVGMARHRDDALGTQLLGGQHPHQPNGAIADHGDGLAGSDLGGVGSEPAGSEHVGGGQQRRDQILVWLPRGSDEGAVGVWDAGLLRLGADGGRDELAVDEARRIPGPADLTGAVGDHERADDEVARLDRLDVAADLFDDADVLVAHGGVVGGFDSAVGPQVRAADARRCDTDDRVGGLDDLRVFGFADADLAGGVHDDCTHATLLILLSLGFL